MVDAELGARRLAAGLRGDRGDEQANALHLVGVDDRRELLIGDRLRRVAEGLLDRWADVLHERVLADDADHIGGVADQRAEPRLGALVHRLLGQHRHAQRERDLAREPREALLDGAPKRPLAAHGEHARELLAREQRRKEAGLPGLLKRDVILRAPVAHRFGELCAARRSRARPRSPRQRPARCSHPRPGTG